MQQVRLRLTAGLAIFMSAVIGLSAASEGAEVKLQLKGGGFEITGELKSFDGAQYVIDSKALGTMSIDAARFDCAGEGCPKAPTVSPAVAARRSTPVENLGTTVWMGGSGIGTTFMPELLKSYAKQQGLLVAQATGSDPRDLEFTLSRGSGQEVGKFIVKRHGVPPGYEGLRTATVDVVWTSARMTDQEEQKLVAGGMRPLRVPGSEHVFALDAMVLLVAKENPAVSISIENIAKIFSGQITDWADIGLPPGKINVYAPVEGMGLLIHFENTILKPRGLKLTPNAIRTKTAIEWSDRVAADPAGIGMHFISYIRNAKALNIETSCGLITRPSVFTAKTEEFALARRLYLYSNGQPKTPLARELLAHALSPAVQEVLRAAEFVDQEPELLPFRDQGARIAYALNASSEDFDMNLMRQLISELTPASRFSTTLRFEVNSSALDIKANQDVDRLAKLLQLPEFQNKPIMLLGFADAVGSFEANLKLSQKRAQSVQKALLAASQGRIPVSRLQVKGYGELAPVACNDSIESRTLNRRVEVWVRN